MTLQTELQQFTGTSCYYKHPFGLKYTDGIQYMAETCGAYWFLDIISTELLALNKTEPFISINLHVADNKGTIKADDGNENPLWERELEYTDFPEGEFRFYLIDGVALLPSEY